MAHRGDLRPHHAERSPNAADQLFYGITITMYWRERDHPVSHFHAEQAGHRASIAIDGTVLAGELPARALRFVQEWAALHRDELQANWERARNLEPLERIDPLP